MQITLTATAEILTINTPDGSIPARIWRGQTDSGIVVEAFIARIAPTDLDHSAAFERELQESIGESPKESNEHRLE